MYAMAICTSSEQVRKYICATYAFGLKTTPAIRFLPINRAEKGCGLGLKLNLYMCNNNILIALIYSEI